MNDKKLYRSRKDSLLFGIAGGIAAHTGRDATIIRLVMVVAGLISFGTATLFYLIAASVIPLEPDTTEVK